MDTLIMFSVVGDSASHETDLRHALYSGAETLLPKKMDHVTNVPRAEGLENLTITIRNILRHTHGNRNQQQFFRADRAHFAAFMGERSVTLTRLEFMLFDMLVQNVDTVVERDDLIAALYPNDIYSPSSTDSRLEGLVSRLRKKVKPLDETKSPYIQARNGQGYQLVEPES